MTFLRPYVASGGVRRVLILGRSALKRRLRESLCVSGPGAAELTARPEGRCVQTSAARMNGWRG